MAHLGKSEIADLLTGRLEEVKKRVAIEHLRGGCVLCQQHVQALTELLQGDEPWLATEPVAEDQYDEAFARAGVAARRFRTRWRKETEKLERALALLDQSPGGLGDDSFPGRQAQALHGWPLCEALLQKSYEARFSDPKRMLNLADSAARVAKHIDIAKYPWPGFVADLRARAFAALGNAYRVNDRFPKAEAAFRQAMGYLKEGTGEPLVQARILDLRASLCGNQGRSEDAVNLLDKVCELYQECDDRHLVGRALTSKAVYTHHQGYPRKAVSLFEEGIKLLEPQRDLQLAAIAQQALLHSLVDCGEYRWASGLLLQSGLRKAFTSEPLNLLRLRWIEGKLHAGLGRPAKAEGALSEVYQSFLCLGQVYDASLVGLDLAAAWLPQGKTTQVRKLAKEMYATFQELGVQREAAKALYFLREA
jgi:tetratricopeptide (TPR) repeat protein